MLKSQVSQHIHNAGTANKNHLQLNMAKESTAGCAADGASRCLTYAGIWDHRPMYFCLFSCDNLVPGIAVTGC